MKPVSTPFGRSLLSGTGNVVVRPPDVAAAAAAAGGCNCRRLGQRRFSGRPGFASCIHTFLGARVGRLSSFFRLRFTRVLASNAAEYTYVNVSTLFCRRAVRKGCGGKGGMWEGGGVKKKT